MDYEKAYKDALERAKNVHKYSSDLAEIKRTEYIFPELKESEGEQNILFKELKALHLRMERQTVCNDAGGNKMWRKAWRLVNEAINVINEDKEIFKW
jgi:hypothetical protein